MAATITTEKARPREGAGHLLQEAFPDSTSELESPALCWNCLCSVPFPTHTTHPPTTTGIIWG